ncbi:glycosyltransferase family 39 protein [Anoxybacillus rupiensis]|uniref:Glycosyltransferase family 39 protein n=1 Tax=Anoxybacteroides rupiense TaxID=311460 RepID=A0ABT5VZ90_9BACL|nr:MULTISPECIES: glycosyltransferase family 39 protein [Anoxybacillus]MDE8562287.1 glycosyltransferase family 39 protein [Anoxybacillus rupiensis]QHC04486.1 phospholipid carrier-dependent glycosyltransferase [Anoxybacillus sp. PDR2]
MKRQNKRKVDFLLIGIIILSFFLHFYQLKEAGSNTYYTVAVKSMLTSFHNFFYASFDPAGFITVDKPPVGLWIQALSAYLLGLSDFSVLLPEALAGVGSVWLMYILVKPKFGRAAALLSSLVLACSPIFVAVARTNNVDSILIFALLLATWALMRSIEKQKPGWLMLGAALIGVGFNIKMLQAYMVLPAFYLFYWIAMKAAWTKRIAHLAMATGVLLAVSLSWALVVEFTPADQRPYIGGSETNSAIELALGYNGISRLTGQNGPGGGGQPGERQWREPQMGAQQQENPPSGSPTVNAGDPSPFVSNGPSNGMPGGFRSNQNAGGAFGTGEPGGLRLFSKELSGQISFLLPFALFGIIPLVAQWVRKRKWDMKQTFTLFWMAWLVPMMGFFSVAMFFHQYYLSMMGPAIAALVGISWTVLWNEYKEQKGWRSWLLPISVLATSLFEALIIYQNKEAVSQGWFIGAIAGGLGFFIALMAIKMKEAISFSLAIAGMLALLVIPAYWTWITIHKEGNAMTPIAGPSNGFGGMAGANRQAQAPDQQQLDGADRTFSPQRSFMQQGGRRSSGDPEEELDTKLLAYLEQHAKGTKWILAVQRAQSAYSMMLHTNYAVMAMGGFGGQDPALTPEKLAAMAKKGEVKYFLIGDGPGENDSVIQWIQENCVEVPSSEWKSAEDSATNQPRAFGRMNKQTLYEYKG